MMKTTATTLACLTLLAGLAVPAQAQDCVPYLGIDHCPVGLATLTAEADGLRVSGVGPDGQDGVASHFDPTTFWNARLELPAGPDTNQTTHLSAISAGEVTSELQITPEDGRLRLEATFTGDSETSTYSVLIYDDAILQGSLGGFSGEPRDNELSGKASGANRLTTRVALYVDGIYMGQIRDPFWWPWISFGINFNGGCVWGMQVADDTTFDLPDGNQVVGDEVRFVEDVGGASHYPYLSFEAIETRSTADFTVTDELAESTCQE